MPNPPVTMADRVGAIGGAAMMACVVFGVAYALHRAISKDSPRKRVQGRPIVWWVSLFMFLGSCFGAWMADNQRYYLHEVVGGMGGFGLLTGLLIGNIHGFIDLYRSRLSPKQTPELELTRHRTLDDKDLENPYSPPRIP
jgi:carbon starvation protein CstA